MEAVMTVLTDKEQALIRPIALAGIPTHGASLGGVVSIDFDRHAFVQEGFVSNVSVQLGVTPLGLPGIGFPLLLGRLFAVFAPDSVSDVCQVLQPDEAMGVLLHNALTHHMVGVLLQPSLSPANAHQTAGSRTSAFLHQTLPESCIVVRSRNNGFTRMKRTLSLRGAGYGKVAYPYIDTDDLLVGFRCWVSYLNFKSHKQVELLPRLVVPELGGSNLGTLLNESNMLGIRGVANNDTPFQREDTHLLLSLEGIVLLVLVGQGRRRILGSLIKSFVAFLGQACFACFCTLLDLCPEGFIGGTDLTGNTTGHLRGEMKTGTYLIVGAILQLHLIAHL